MSVVTQKLRELQLAFMLLSRLPVGKGSDDMPQLSTAGWAYPLVGLVLGSIAALVLWVCVSLLGLSAAVSALLTVSSIVLLTGALHEDGLADTADGFGGGRDITRKLEIMRDSRIGSYGVMALILVTLLRISALSGLPMAVAVPSMIAVLAFSRCLIPMVMSVQSSARQNGLGVSAGSGSRASNVIAVIIGATLVVLLLPISTALVVALSIVLTTLAVSMLAQQQIKGFTGDTLGATIQLSEAVAFVALLALVSNAAG